MEAEKEILPVCFVYCAFLRIIFSCIALVQEGLSLP